MGTHEKGIQTYKVYNTTVVHILKSILIILHCTSGKNEKAQKLTGRADGEVRDQQEMHCRCPNSFGKRKKPFPEGKAEQRWRCQQDFHYFTQCFIDRIRNK